jgi:hypothetical protein
MDLKQISIQTPSARVLGKLKRGGMVRLTHGSGLNLLVLPENYNHITRVFSKGNGLHYAMSPEEIHHNHASGVFDKAKALVSKAVTVAKPVAKAGLKIAKPFIKKGVESGISSVGNFVAASNPELAPIVPAGVSGAQHLANNFIDNVGNGLYAEPMSGNGLYAEPMRARGLRKHREVSSVGVHGNLIGGDLLPPALRPQPYSANFQFQHTLPPAYQTFSKSGR